MKIGRDVEGNKVLKIEKCDYKSNYLRPRAISFPTLNVMPETHKMNAGYFDPVVALLELEDYIERCGTDEQKILILRQLDRQKIKSYQAGLVPPSATDLSSPPPKFETNIIPMGNKTEVFDL